MRGTLQLVTGFCLLLTGCPQLLDDGFSNLSSRDVEVYGDADAGFLPGVGGADGGAAGGNTGGSDGVGAAGGSVQPSQVTVISTLPADGARGVLPDAVLVITFSAPMDTATVGEAYSSSELPAEQVSFDWSEGDSVLRVQPKAALRVAAGTNPNLVEAARYTVALSAQARDKQGGALAEKQISFSVARSIKQSLKAVQDRDLTGHWRSDSTYGIIDCERADTTICVGDGALTGQPDPAYKALMTFELSSLPGDAISITAAELGLAPTSIQGTPFPDLGTLQVEHVEFSSIGDAAYAVPALSARQLMSTGAAAGESMTVGVLSDVQSDWGARPYSQYRLAFDTPTNDDDAPDQLVCSWTGAQLDVTYWLP